MTSNTSPLRRTALALAALVLPLAAPAATNIVRDNSLGTGPLAALPPLGSVSSGGVTYARIPILEQYGSRAGSNLFHSFRVFDVGAGDAAVFYVGAPTSNIISRVTGGQASQIAGLITVDAGATGSRPNVYLVNPAGVTFSAGAAIDVPAAFHVSTADVLTFADGRFESDPARTSTLSSAAPAAFGFLGGGGGAVIARTGVSLQGAAGSSLTVTARDILLDGAFASTTNADLRLAATGTQAASVPLSGALPKKLGGLLYLKGEASAVSFTFNDQAAGDVLASAGDLWLGDGTGAKATYLGSFAGAGSKGRSGRVEADVGGDLYLDSGASLMSDTSGSGAGGDVLVRTGAAYIESGREFSGIYTYGLAGSSGKVGAVNLAAQGLMVLSNGGQVFSNSNGTGGSGAVTVSGGAITLDGSTGAPPAIFSRSGETGGAVGVTASDALVVKGGGTIGSYTYGTGAAGAVGVAGASVVLTGAGSLIGSSGFTGASGDAGAVRVQAQGTLTISDGAAVASSVNGIGSTGGVLLAARDILIDGRAGYASVSSSVLSASAGDAGLVDLRATNTLAVLGDSAVTAQIGGTGASAGVSMQANTIHLEGDPGLPVTVASISRTGSASARGAITLQSAGVLSIPGNVNVATLATGSGDAGDIVLAGGEIMLGGPAANVVISTGATTGSTGRAGDIDISSRGSLAVRGALVATSTNGAGDAGAVRVHAGSMTIDAGTAFAGINSDARAYSSGAAGDISVKVDGSLAMLSEGIISSRTFGPGSAGAVHVEAGSIVIDGRASGAFTGITTNALEGSSGNAGTVTVRVHDSLVLRDFGEIASATNGSGSAGAITVDAATILIDNAQIAASATSGSSGQVGHMAVRASESITMRNGALLNLQNAAVLADPSTLAPGGLLLFAPVVLLDGSYVSSTSLGNVAAGGIALQAGERLALRNESAIITSANNANGGPIAIDGGQLVWLKDSAITTSVLGQSGNGGDIALKAAVLLLDSGQVKANTASTGRSGGDIRIDAGALVTSGSTLLLGGSTRYELSPGVFGFNVIQAAAPTGVSGTIALTNPLLDIAGSLAGLAVPHIDTGGLGRNPCQATGGSSLVQAGRGGPAPSARGLLGPRAAPAPVVSWLAPACSKG